MYSTLNLQVMTSANNCKYIYTRCTFSCFMQLRERSYRFSSKSYINKQFLIDKIYRVQQEFKTYKFHALCTSNIGNWQDLWNIKLFYLAWRYVTHFSANVPAGKYNRGRSGYHHVLHAFIYNVTTCSTADSPLMPY